VRSGVQDEEGWGWGAFLLPYLEQGPPYQQLGVETRTLHQALVAGALPLAQTSLKVYVCPSDDGGPLMESHASSAVPNGRFFNGLAAVGPGSKVAKSNYVACAGFFSVQSPNNNGGMFTNSQTGFRDIIDGTSYTFAVGERNRYCAQGAWVGNRNPNGGGPAGADYTMGLISWPLNSPANQANECIEGFASNHSGGANFVFWDGSVRFVRDTISFNNGGLNGTTLVSNAANLQALAAVFPTLGIYQRLGIRNDGMVVNLD
jgi:prepilin-type processing-associated H-X9-DG protein